MGIPFLLFAIVLKEGTWFDIVVGLFHACWAAALVFVLSGVFREVNKPEE
jgi:hypothetical protein